ncbi:MAG: enoyl-CoA hydratase/isomerase family protein [Balneolaceae bacterium]
MVGSVSLTISDNIGTIEFQHPKGNSLPKKLLNELAEEINAAGSDKKIAVIVLKSVGNGAFCAGASFDELAEIDSNEKGSQFFSGFAKVILAMKNCPKLILCRVQGKAVGGGVGIIAAADYAIASSEASIKLSELNLGIGPFVIAPVVERKIGISALSSLSINASSWRSANWANEKGLYNDVFESSYLLDEAINTLATNLSKSSPEAMMELKNVLWEGFELMEDKLKKRAQISGALAQSDFTKKFIEQFKS